MSYEACLSLPAEHRLLILDPSSTEAAIPPMFDLVALRIPRSEVEGCDPQNAERVLRRLLHDRDTVVRLAASVSFVVEGYETDPRELYWIPEVRRYFAALDRRFVDWCHFVTSDHLALVIACLSDTSSEDGWALDSEKVQRTVKIHLRALERLYRRFDLPRCESEARAAAIREFVKSRFGDLAG